MAAKKTAVQTAARRFPGRPRLDASKTAAKHKPVVVKNEVAATTTGVTRRKVITDEDDGDDVVLNSASYFADPSKKANDDDHFSTGCAIIDAVLGGGYVLGRVANIVGDKSSGKCARDFYFLTEDGLQYSDDLGAPFAEGATPWVKKLALDNKRTSLATHFYKEKVKSTLRYATEHGFELIATPDHKVLVLAQDMRMVMKPMSEIMLDDHVVVASATNMFPKTRVSLDLANHTITTAYIHIDLPDEMTAPLAGLLGFIVTDGTLSSGPMVISNTKGWAAIAINELSEAAWATKPMPMKGGWRFSNQVKELMPQLFGQPVSGMTAAFKFVPPSILRSPREVQQAFLKAVLSCDSYIVDNGLTYTTASRRLAREVQMMLLNFGVVATLQENWTKLEQWDEARCYWDLSLHGERWDMFLELIGTYREVQDRHVYGKTTSDYLSIPYVGDALRDEITAARNRLGWSKNGRLEGGGKFPRTGMFARRHPGLSRQTLADTLELLDGYLDAEFVTRCEAVLASNYVFERVVAFEQIDGPQTVYDVHVPDGHLFWASGFVSHNTLLAIEACANFHKKYPTGHIRYAEAEAAFDQDYAAALGMPVDAVDFVGPNPDKAIATVEDFHDDMMASMDAHKDVPMLYVLDSLDALSDKAEATRDISENSYGGSKARKLSELFRRIVKRLETSRVCLIVISQLRDKLNVTFGEKQTRSGGRALDFYASQTMWLAEIEKLKRTVEGIERVVGIKIRARTKKNKVGINYRQCDYPLLFGYGIDDLTANVEWLIENKCVSRLPAMQLSQAGYKIRIGSLRNKGGPDAAELRANLRAAVFEEWARIEKSFLPPTSKY